MVRTLFALLTVAIALPAAAETETTWMKVTLEGRKIGHLASTREVTADRVITIERMEVTIDRAGISLSMSTQERSVETRDGRPLGFGARTALAGTTTEVDGHVADDGSAQVRIVTTDREELRRIDWPEGAVLAEGARLAEKRHGLAPGTRYRLLAFQPSDLIALPVDASVIGSERVRMNGRRESLVRIEHRIELPGAAMQTRAWVTPEHEVRRIVMPLLGQELEMIACSKRCAMASNQTADILTRTLVRSPRALRRAELVAGLRYELELRGDEPPRLPDTSEQHVLPASDTRQAVVRVDPSPDSPDTTAPVDDDLQPNRWLQSDDAGIRALAEEAIGDIAGADARMRRLESFVRGFITDKNLAVGYASAAETVRTRSGDCTEHALLLAALGRALGIPTRVVSGLAYAPGFAGRDHVFVPHAWTEGWTGTAWASYDAALAGFDAGHIAISIGDGDPSGFYAGVSILGNVRIVSAEPLERAD